MKKVVSKLGRRHSEFHAKTQSREERGKAFTTDYADGTDGDWFIRAHPCDPRGMDHARRIAVIQRIAQEQPDEGVLRICRPR